VTGFPRDSVRSLHSVALPAAIPRLLVSGLCSHPVSSLSPVEFSVYFYYNPLHARALLLNIGSIPGNIMARNVILKAQSGAYETEEEMEAAIVMLRR